MFRTTHVLTLLMTVASVASAQNPYLLDVYGDGVHAYHRGDHARACEQFNKAINNGARDPRIYYFRALKSLQSGDSGSAEQDIRTGVMFELRGQGTYDIGMALARVQGPHRIQFEDMRLDAKLEMSGRQVDPQRSLPSTQPYMDPSRIDDRPLADDLPVGPAFSDDPFRDDDEGEADASDLDLDDSMSDDPVDDPLADDPLADDAGMNDELPEPDQFDDLPADDLPADDDPFGPEPEAGSDDPFGPQPEDAGGDPFADDPGTGDAGGDPFADDVPEDNPFE